MAEGKEHAVVGRAVITVTTVTAMAATGAAWYYLKQPVALAVTTTTLGVVSGTVMGYLITPDIDHEWYTVEEQRIKRALGGTVLFLWKLFWFPFVLARHRSRLTHSWPLATALKMLWLFGWLLVATMAILLSFNVKINNAAVAAAAPFFVLWCIGFFGGWSIQDLLHLAMDK